VTGRRSIPDPAPEWSEWWEATRNRRFLLQQCTRCATSQHYPRAICTSCGSTDLRWRDASGKGTIYSYSVVHRAPPSAPPTPYVVALVRLAEGPTILTNVVGCDVADVACDAPATLVWEELDDGRCLPLFTPTRVTTTTREAEVS
jgi:uncharacterized OB-fold protein